eukprot:TRINITY_DN19483_c0_g1_i3.p1 TRINITY_DN19483_c0_g1~~TRINITY_DN19483_c0_g1_i3.p1  ORF type:complete len:588 (+),score=82.76 TRINITY_DN19483_c0_g1_i3:224-1765(+)
MGNPTIGATTGATCQITTDIPSQGYTSGNQYTLTVTSSTPFAQKVTCNDQGAFAGGGRVKNNDQRGSSYTYQWTASGSSPAKFRAMCGGWSDMWLSDIVSVAAIASPVSPTPLSSPTPPTPSPTPSPSPILSPSSSSANGGLELLPGMSLTSHGIKGEQIDLEVRSNRNGWIGIGFANGEEVSMTGGSAGADVFACSGGGPVKRYWVTSKYIDTGSGRDVEGSQCSFVNGEAIMRFQRKLSAGGGRRLSDEVAVTPGKQQMLIYARGRDGTTSISIHDSSDRGGKLVDLESLKASEANKKDGGAALWIHVICMTVAWGFLLPLGVAIANRVRKNADAPQGAWFKLHRGMQCIGWAVQILGFVMALAHCSSEGAHFQNAHTWIGLAVVILGTLQPINAALRKLCKHPHDGEPKTAGRMTFEVVHKGAGYIAVFGGIINCWMGVAQLDKLGFAIPIIAVGIALSALGLLMIFGYTAWAFVNVNNPISKALVKLVSDGRAPLPESVDGTKVGNAIE